MLYCQTRAVWIYVSAWICVYTCGIYMFEQSSSVQIEQEEIVWPAVGAILK